MGARDHAALNYGPLMDMVGYQLRRANDIATKRFFSVLSDMGITPGQIGVLTLIANNGGLTQSALSRGVGVDRSTMVAVIDRLEETGLVARARAERDQRAYALQLTQKGDTLVAKLLERLQSLEDELLTKLSREERDTLVSLLRKMAT